MRLPAVPAVHQNAPAGRASSPALACGGGPRPLRHQLTDLARSLRHRVLLCNQICNQMP